MSPAPVTSRSPGRRERVVGDARVHDWYRDAVIYELHVRGFADADGDGVGDFKGLISRLDYLTDLGVTALWLLPFYPSPLRDDGYDIADYHRINPVYGDMRTFKRFVAAAHDRGLRVITELVINHTSDAHPWFQRARRSPAGSEYRDFYVWSDTDAAYADARVIFGDFESSNWTWDPVAGAYYWHRFYHHQPDLNFDNPAVEGAIFEVFEFWLDMGVDGLRLDAVPYLYEREGTNCENLPETHEYLRRLRRHLDERFEDRMLLAEANQWPEDAAEYFGDGDECHMNFHFPLMPRLFMAVERESRTPIVDILEQTPKIPDGAQWAIFLRNHDELTLEMVTDEERDYMVQAYAEDPRMRVNLGIRRRLASLLQRDRRKIELMNALLFSLPGTPVLYYGDEIGMGDNVYLGDRDAVRTPMQWSPDRNAGFSVANPHQLYLPVITEPGAHYENVNVEAQQHRSSSLLSWMRQMIALRKRMPVMGRGEIEFLEPENPRVITFVRSMPDATPVLVVANLSRMAQAVELDLTEFIGHTPVEVFGRTRFAPVGELPYYLTLAPYGFFWLELEAPSVPGPATMPTLSGTWPAVLRNRGVHRAMRNWLPNRRWYGAKGEPITEVHLDDVIPLERREVAIVVVRLSFAHGADQRYLVPLAHLSGERAASLRRLHPEAVFADLDDPDATDTIDGDDADVIFDAMVDEDSSLALVELMGSRRRSKGRSLSVQGRPSGRLLKRTTELARSGEGAGVSILGVEQSNSSVIVDGTVIAKLVRRLEPGPSRDVELPRALRASGFAHVPEVLGELAVDLRSRSGDAIGMVAHRVVSNDGDMWQWFQDELARLIDAVIESHDEPVEDLLASSVDMAERLGRRTAGLHIALAAITPEPLRYTLLHQRGMRQAIHSELRETQRMLRRHRNDTRRRNDTGSVGDGRQNVVSAGDPAAESEETPMMAYLDAQSVLARIEPLRTRKLDALRIELHGDLHLGQVLWTGRDVVFIDFEGEPARSLSERSIVRNPLADVAGMQRSFDYAARVAGSTARERGVVPVSESGYVEAFCRSWTVGITERFWQQYQHDVDATGLIPADPGDREMLLDAFMVSKALYEVRYELSNRPHWAHWPLDALGAVPGDAAMSTPGATVEPI